MKRRKRPSGLVVGELCGHSTKLAEENKQGSVYSVGGTADHATMAKAVEGTLDEKHRFNGVVACLPEGKREAEVQIELHDPLTGEWILGEPDEKGERTGKADCVVTAADGGITVVDWKFGDLIKVMPPDENLQILAYAVSLAIARKAPWFKVAIWGPRGGWMWGMRKWLPSDYMGLVERIQAVDNMDPDVPIVGPHCGDHCYSRSYCRAFMLPVVTDGHMALEPFTKEGGLNADNIVQATIQMKAMKDAVDIVKGRVESWIAQHGPVNCNGKTYGPIPNPGRRSISLAVIEDRGFYDLLDKAGCITKAADGVQYRWTNTKKA